MNDGIILNLAYPETIVSHAEEWYSKYMRFVFIGNRKHVRAGHAALVLINKKTGVLEYHDFGRYITPSPNGRVRGQDTDFELRFPISAELKDDTILNLEEILKFLATNPKLTHGDGTLYASVCNTIDYNKARTHIESVQKEGFIRYAAFVKNACNCARFVTDTLIASITDDAVKNKLMSSKWFTPSTIGNVVIAATEDYVHAVSNSGELSEFTSTVGKENRRLFLDVLKGYKPGVVGMLKPKQNGVKADHAQWLSGIAAGAWFELYATDCKTEFRYRRVSHHGNVDCDGIYQVMSTGFDSNENYEFVHYSNCKFFHINQKSVLYRFEYLKAYSL